MNIDHAIQEYGYNACITSPTYTERFRLVIEDELDIYLQHIYGDYSIPCLRFKQFTGGYLYVLPTTLMQVDTAGELHVIFDINRQGTATVQHILRGFKDSPIRAIYTYTLDMN